MQQLKFYSPYDNLLCFGGYYFTCAPFTLVRMFSFICIPIYEELIYSIS